MPLGRHIIMSVELEHAIGCNVAYSQVAKFHPNGKDYVKAVGGCLVITDLGDPHEQVFLRGHDDFVSCLTISTDGEMIASGQVGKNADVILWDFQSRRLIYRFQEHDNGVESMCFSHDGRFLCTCGDSVDQRFFVWDTAKGLILAWTTISPKPTCCIVQGGFVKDVKRRDTDEYQFACCGGKSVMIWGLDPVKGELTPNPVNAAGKQVREYTCLAFTEDYEYLIAGTTTGDVVVILMKNRVIQCYVPAAGGGVCSLVVLRNPMQGVEAGTQLLVGGGDGTLTYVAGPTPKELRDQRQIKLDGGVRSLSLSPDQVEAMAHTAAGTGFRVRTKDMSFMCLSQSTSGGVTDVVYPHGISDLFITCCDDGLVTLYDANDYSARLRLHGRTRTMPVCVAGSPDIIVAGYNDGRMMGFEARAGEFLWNIDNVHKGLVSCLQLATNLRFVVSAGNEGDIRVWELKTKEHVSHLKEHQARVNALYLFPNDQYAVSASRDRCLLTWDLRAERRLTLHRQQHAGINSLGVAGDQTTVVTASQEKTITYWDLRMADPARVINVDEEIASLSLASDDRLFVTGGEKGEVKLWDLKSGQMLSAQMAHSRPISRVTFSADAKQAVSVGMDNAVMVWNVYN